MGQTTWQTWSDALQGTPVCGVEKEGREAGGKGGGNLVLCASRARRGERSHVGPVEAAGAAGVNMDHVGSDGLRLAVETEHPSG